MTTVVAVAIIIAVIAGVFIWRWLSSAAIDAAAVAVNKKLLYKSEYEEGLQITSTPLTFVVPKTPAEVIRALSDQIVVADHVPTAFKAVLYKSLENSKGIAYHFGNKAVPIQFQVVVSCSAMENSGNTVVLFKVMKWNERDGLVVGYQYLRRLRDQVQATLSSMGGHE